jgi:trk system potassium uptake protein
MFDFPFRKKQHLIIIAGASRFGARIAGLFSEKGNDVIVIDTDKNAFRKLLDNFSGLTVEGDASDTSVLEAVRIRQASICVAATDNDSTNSMIAQIAGSIYSVPEVYCRLNDTSNTDMLKRSNIHIICPSDLCLQEFERQSTTAGRGEKAS